MQKEKQNSKNKKAAVDTAAGFLLFFNSQYDIQI